MRRLVSRAMARDLTAFVVPGAEVARACGLDLRVAGLTIAPTPRHANVLLVVGGLPEGLGRAAVVAYAQMPRPRAVLALGAAESSLPVAADASGELDQDSLQSGVAELRRLFSEGAFDTRARPFEAEELESKTEYACPMHPEVVQDEPGTCPKCGMDLVAQEAGGSGHDHGAYDHGEHDHGGAESDEEEGEDPIPDPVSGQDFMSMIEMTQGTPRGSDGLQMEWVRAPFGPLFPGLPGGLALAFTLDGDTVARTKSGSAVGRREVLEGAAASLAERMAELDPLSPVSYRLLAYRAIEDAVGLDPSDGAMPARIALLERERAASHLNWLSGFGHVIGYSWLAGRASGLQLDLLAGEGPGVSGIREEVRKLTHRLERTPLLRRRLAGIARLDATGYATGPVARASGSGTDSRAAEEGYLALGFEPSFRDGGDALDRLRLRLAEISQSLALVEDAGSFQTGVAEPEWSAEEASGSGTAVIETPRGTATLNVQIEDGQVVSAGLRTPSEAHLPLVKDVTLQREVGEALVGVASLDLSPWGVTVEDPA